MQRAIYAKCYLCERLCKRIDLFNRGDRTMKIDTQVSLVARGWGIPTEASKQSFFWNVSSIP